MTAHTVVLGRGNPYQQYPGNLRLAQIIDEHRVAYNTSDKANKTVISKRIVELVKESNGRFLKKRRRRSSTTRKQKTSSNKVSTTTPIMASAVAAAVCSRSGDSVVSDNDEDPGGGGSVDQEEDDDDDTAISDGSRGSQPPPPPSQHGPQEEEDKVEGWIEVSDDVARNKVSHGFRTKTRRNADKFQ